MYLWLACNSVLRVLPPECWVKSDECMPGLNCFFFPLKQPNNNKLSERENLNAGQILLNILRGLGL